MTASNASNRRAALVELLIQVLRLTVLLVFVGWLAAMTTRPDRADAKAVAFALLR
jgi:Na+/phosphate symporter